MASVKSLCVAHHATILWILLSVVASGLMLQACEQQNRSKALPLEAQGRNVPVFNGDSAFLFVKKQVELGPRNPGSKGHWEMKNVLNAYLGRFAGSAMVFQQHFNHIGYENDTLALTNFVAAFNPSSRSRIMLCAHWDTRPRSDESEDPNMQQKPILGANDGASGVAVLLEIARHLHHNPPPVGVDIVLFDGEDYGKQDSLQHYFLGSRYWSEHPPVKGYNPRFAILLDMVGGKKAVFPKEQYSLQYAAPVVHGVWNVAHELGYQQLFLDRRGRAIQDDHLIINREAGIPAIDIIHHNPTGKSQFPSYWHTQQDNLSNISPDTMEKVGQVLLELIYNRL